MKPSRQSVSYIGADIQYAIGEYKNFASISKTPFIAPFNSSLTIWPSTFINCWLSGIGYDVRLTRVSKETGETETCTVSNALNSQGAEFIRCNTIHTVPTDTDDVKKLPDGLYTYTVEYSTFNDAQEQTGWFTPLLFQNTPSNTFYLEKKDKQCIFYETSDIYNVIDYKYIDTDDALGWINIHSNKDINSITVDSNIIFSCNIDVPFFKMPATEMTEENCIVQTSIIREDGTLYYKNSTNLECNSAETEPNTGEELYSAFASNSHPGTFESPGTYTLVVEVPLFGYSIKKEFTVGDKQESGITSITSTHSPNSSAVYTLSGQRVTSNYKGIVISNGKKKVVR